MLMTLKEALRLQDWTQSFSKKPPICYRWNLVPRLIRICRIQWWVLLFLFSTVFRFFWVNLVQKIKIVGLNWNLVRRLICICKNNRDVHFSCYWLKIPFLGKFSSKNQKCEFKIKIDTNTISNMQNSLILFTFFKLEILFLSKFSPICLKWSLVPD